MKKERCAVRYKKRNRRCKRPGTMFVHRGIGKICPKHFRRLWKKLRRLF